MKKQLHRILAFTVIAVFVLQIVAKFSILVNYAVNKEYIAKAFCENKAKPILHCNGKCHLKKQLEKQEKKEKPTSTSAKEKFEVTYFSETRSLFNIQPIYFEVKKIVGHYSSDFSDQNIESVFHPPQV